MAQQYDNEMKGIVFLQDRQTDRHPDYKGSIQIDGVQYWVSGWTKETKKGPAISLSLEKAKPAGEAYPKPAIVSHQAEQTFFNDDIPF